jgi:hypothetical protein
MLWMIAAAVWTLSYVPLALAVGKTKKSFKPSKTEEAAPVCPTKKTARFVGKLHTVVPGAYTVTAKAQSSTMTFKVCGDCKISTVEKSSATLLDLKLGEEYVFTHKVNEFGTDVVAAIAPSRAAANRSK